MTHTPGPWIIDDLQGGDDVIILADVITVDDSINVCQVFGGLDFYEKMGNSFLIAAAPEMLAALKLVAENWATNKGVILDAVKAAIEQAEGRERPVKKRNVA